MMNPYLPVKATIAEIREETGGRGPSRRFAWFRKMATHSTRSRAVRYGRHPARGGKHDIDFLFTDTEGYLEFSIMKLGKVTSALHAYEAGETITIRGPYGNGFPIAEWKGKNIVTIGGGIGQRRCGPSSSTSWITGMISASLILLRSPVCQRPVL